MISEEGAFSAPGDCAVAQKHIQLSFIPVQPDNHYSKAFPCKPCVFWASCLYHISTFLFSDIRSEPWPSGDNTSFTDLTFLGNSLTVRVVLYFIVTLYDSLIVLHIGHPIFVSLHGF